MRRICVIRHGHYPQDVRVRKEVHALQDAGYAVDVICLRDQGQMARETVEGVQVYRLGSEHRRGSLLRYFCEYAIGFLRMFLLVTALFCRRRYRCIQVNTLPDALVFVTIIPRLCGAKVLLDMHEPSPELFVTKYGPNRFRWAVKLIALAEQLALRYATAALAVNDTIRTRYIERGACGRKIHVVRNVPERDLATAGSRRSHNGSFTLLLHGLIAERYGHEMTIRALAKVRERIENVHLIIAGYGDNEERVRNVTEELNCSDIVTFLGWVPPERIRELIASTDVGLVPLLPSPFADLCQPNKLFELVSGRRAVIVSRLTAIEENFDDSCAMFFEPGSQDDLARCILDLYLDPKKRQSLAENAYRRYETISWTESRKTYLSVIDRLAGVDVDKGDRGETAQDVCVAASCDTTDDLPCRVG